MDVVSVHLQVVLQRISWSTEWNQFPRGETSDQVWKNGKFIDYMSVYLLQQEMVALKFNP